MDPCLYSRNSGNIAVLEKRVNKIKRRLKSIAQQIRNIEADPDAHKGATGATGPTGPPANGE